MRWEEVTYLTADHAWKAMQHHSERIVFLDVDCRVLGPLNELADVRAEVAFYVRAKLRKSGGMCFGLRSGTVVLRPTCRGWPGNQSGHQTQSL